MYYRDAGRLTTSYPEDAAIFPLAQDRWAMMALGVVAIALVTFASEYWLVSILIPFLIFAIAAIGLNLLVGYAGQLSLGTGGFMAIGAFAAYNLAVRVPGLNLLVVFVLAGLIAAVVGVLFGLPSLRIKGFYLAVATLALQFFVEWLFLHVSWFSNDSTSGIVTAPRLVLFGWDASSPKARYLLLLAITLLVAVAAKNLTRSPTGRQWMAIRDMDIAAESIGVRPMRAKLLAFAISSFYCGLAGALWVFFYIGTVEVQAFDLTRSFQILFMVIIGGLGTILGSFLGAAFIVFLPIWLSNVFSLFGTNFHADLLSHVQLVIYGAVMLLVLVVEPHGLARIWQQCHEKLRLWPFPY